jgi:hypothetical protein
MGITLVQGWYHLRSLTGCYCLRLYQSLVGCLLPVLIPCATGQYTIPRLVLTHRSTNLYIWYTMYLHQGHNLWRSQNYGWFQLQWMHCGFKSSYDDSCRPYSILHMVAKTHGSSHLTHQSQKIGRLKECSFKENLNVREGLENHDHYLQHSRHLWFLQHLPNWSKEPLAQCPAELPLKQNTWWH